MSDSPPIHRVAVTFTGTPPTRPVGLASGVTDVEVDDHTLRCLVHGSVQPFLEAVRGYEVTNLTSTELRPATPEQMTAVTHPVFGPAKDLRLRTVPTPKPGAGEVLVRVRAASLNPWDWHFMRGLPYLSRLSGAGLRRPKHPILGSDVAGEVEAVGTGATRFRPGDQVYGFVGFGAFAEFVAVPEDRLARRPGNLTWEQAAALPLAGMTALQGLRDAGQVRRGQRVMIIGASGGVGTMAVQIAVALGAVVTGVCSTRNVDLVRSLGATQVIDYTRDDPTRSGAAYDVILQLAGTASPAQLRRILTPTGGLVLSSGDSAGRLIGPFDRILEALALSPFVSQTLRPLVTKPSPADLDELTRLVEGGQLTPVVEHTFPLADTAAAIRHLETGRVRGKLALAVPPFTPPITKGTPS
jgi:NADPH:quinone reductase-like Zn-dependent oxidoreductase